MQTLDLSGHVQALEQAQANHRASMRQPIDIQQDYLLRVVLGRIGDRHHCLSVIFHHLITDGKSFCFVFDELGRQYLAAQLNPVPEPDLSKGNLFAEFVYTISRTGWRCRMTWMRRRGGGSGGREQQRDHRTIEAGLPSRRRPLCNSPWMHKGKFSSASVNKYMYQRLTHLFESWSPSRWEGKVQLLRSAEIASIPDDCGWGPHTGGQLVIHRSQLPHHTFTPAHHAVLADALLRIIR